MNEDTTDRSRIRPAALAGTWYPGTKATLQADIDRLLGAAQKIDLGGQLHGLVAPHAGYMFSGQIAAHAYKQLEGSSFSTAVIVGPSHRVYHPGILVSDKDYYQTPLGLVKVDNGSIKRLAEEVDITYLRQDLEHSLEIQLPFIQRVLPDCQIVPLMLADQSFPLVESLAKVIAKVFDDSKTILIASSDLSHFHSYSEAKSMDGQVIAELEAFNPIGLYKSVEKGEAEACGFGAMTAVMLAASQQGANHAKVLYYANSGDITGDRSSVVGYLSAAIFTAT